jgi:hypothetical protein
MGEVMLGVDRSLLASREQKMAKTEPAVSESPIALALRVKAK